LLDSVLLGGNVEQIVDSYPCDYVAKQCNLFFIEAGKLTLGYGRGIIYDCRTVSNINHALLPS